MTNTSEDPQYLTEYFSGIAKGDFYAEPVQESIQIRNQNYFFL